MADLLLHDGLLFAQGIERLVYRHPDDSQLVVKVFRPEYLVRKFGANAPWYKPSRRSGYLSALLREWQEQFVVLFSERDHPIFLQKNVGIVSTNLGFGQVVKAVRGRDAEYAPTLYQLIGEQRFDATAKRALERFFDWLLHSPIVISELNSLNLLYGYDDISGDYFCLVDGIGDTGFIPVKSWFAFLNRRHKQRCIKKMWHRLAQILRERKSVADLSKIDLPVT